MIDDGFQIFIPKLASDDCKVIWLSISDKHVITRGLGANTFAGTPFTWDQIKDYYIPMLKLLSNRYEIIGFGGYFNKKEVRFRLGKNIHPDSFKDFSYDSVLDDTLFDLYSYEPDIYSVGIKIKEKL